MRRLIVPLSLSLALAVPAAVSAQSMAEAAAKEKARREKLRQGKPAPKVITEEDLRSGGRPRGTVSNPAATEAVDANAAGAPATDASPATNAAPPPAQKSDEELVAQRRQEWRERMTRAQTDVQNLSQRADQLQLKANDVSGNIYGAGRANLLSELESTKILLATARQTLATLEDEGRRNNFQM